MTTCQDNVSSINCFDNMSVNEALIPPGFGSRWVCLARRRLCKRTHDPEAVEILPVR